MAQSFLGDLFSRISTDIESGRSNPITAQTEIGRLVKSGSLSKDNALQLFDRLQPTFKANPFKQKVLNDTELAEVRADLAARRPIEISKLSSAINQGGVTDAEADQYRKDLRKAQGRTEKTFDPSALRARIEARGRKRDSAPSVDKTGTEKAQKTSPVNRQDFNNLIDALKESKRTASTRDAFNTELSRASGPTASTRDAFNTELSRASGPSSKVVNRPVTITDNVTKPSVNVGSSKAERKQARTDQEIENAIAATKGKGLTPQQEQDLAFGIVQSRTGPKFDKGQFNFLLDKLTGSKIRQNRDAQSQERQNIYSRGLASMFSNF